MNTLTPKRPTHQVRARAGLILLALTFTLFAACDSKTPEVKPSDEATPQELTTEPAIEPATADECLSSEDCKKHGRCTTGEDGKGCVATTDQGCAASSDCVELGKCQAGDYFAPYCKCGSEDEEECGEWLRQVCIVGQESCQESKACKERGACSPSNWCGGHACVSRSDADCAASTRCKTHGECAFLGSSSIFDCAPTKKEHCLQADICTKDKRCALGNATCQ